MRIQAARLEVEQRELCMQAQIDGGEVRGTGLRLIALRFDPCSARNTCSPEVRAIFQPIITDPLGVPTAGKNHAWIMVGGATSPRWMLRAARSGWEYTGLWSLIASHQARIMGTLTGSRA